MQSKMTTIDDHGMDIHKHINRFIEKLYRIINSDEPTVRWVPGGRKFLILDPKKFSQTVLPKYFKHSKFTSFVRQLNFYGFHKQRIVPNEIIRDENDTHALLAHLGDAVCFQHEFFQENQPKLLLRIQRTTKQSLDQSTAETLLSLNKQKEIEDLKEQVREMKKQMDSFKDEFNIKLASVRAEVELDYLHRIQVLEVCYKDLVKMLLRSNITSNIDAASLARVRSISNGSRTSAVTAAVPPVGTATSTTSSTSIQRTTAPTNDPRGGIRMRQNYSPLDFLEKQTLGMRSQHPSPAALQAAASTIAAGGGDSRRRGTTTTTTRLYDDLAANPRAINVDALVLGAATTTNNNDNNKIDELELMKASLSEILRRERHRLSHFATGNSAA